MGEGFHGHKTVGERPAWTDGRTGRRTDPFVFRVYVFRPRSFLTATGMKYSKGGLLVGACLDINLLMNAAFGRLPEHQGTKNVSNASAQVGIF